MKAIKIKTIKGGRQRAYYWSRRAFRWLPMPLAQAEIEIATEQAYRAADDAL